MLREKKFHTLIEQQDAKDKEMAWEKLKTGLDLQDDATAIEIDGNGPVLSIRSKRRIISLVLASLILLFTIALIIGLLLQKDKKNSVRYCVEEDYTVEVTDVTLAEYSLQTNQNILHFDWYNDTEYLDCSLMKLKETEEIICISEVIMDMEGGYIIKLSVTDSQTMIDAFSDYYNVCLNKATIGSSQVCWGSLNDNSVAYFEYEKHLYYLEIFDSPKNDCVLEYVEKLVP